MVSLQELQRTLSAFSSVSEESLSRGSSWRDFSSRYSLFSCYFLGRVTVSICNVSALQDSCHYLFYSILFVSCAPITMALLPVVLYAALHAANFAVSVLQVGFQYDTHPYTRKLQPFTKHLLAGNGSFRVGCLSNSLECDYESDSELSRNNCVCRNLPHSSAGVLHLHWLVPCLSLRVHNDFLYRQSISLRSFHLLSLSHSEILFSAQSLHKTGLLSGEI